MKAGFRGWLYRWISALFGMVGILVCLSLLEVSRLYAFPRLFAPAAIGLAVAFLLFMTAFLGVWSWKRYLLLSLMVGTLAGLPYIAFRPEMIRDDLLKPLVAPPLTIDLVVYRSWMLRADPERDVKIERLQFLYGLLNTYGENRRASGASAPSPAQ